MAERRADVAPFRTALYSAILAWWAAEGNIVEPTTPTPTTHSRPPLAFPNSGYSPGDDPAFVEVEYLPGSSTLTGNAPRPGKITPGILQFTNYVIAGSGDALLDLIMDREALMLREISVATLHSFSTDDPVPAPAPPAGFYGHVVRAACLRISQPATS